MPALRTSDLCNRQRLNIILNNLKRFESGEQPADEAEEEREGKQFVIEKVSISDVRVEVELLPVGGDLEYADSITIAQALAARREMAT